SAAALDQFAAAALDQFAAAVARQFTAAVLDQFVAAALDQFAAAALDQFSAAALDGLVKASVKQFSAAALDQFTAAVARQFSAAALDQFSAAALDQFRAAVARQFAAAALDQLAKATLDQFTAAALDQLMAAALDSFSKAVGAQFSAAALDRFNSQVRQWLRGTGAARFRAIVAQQAAGGAKARAAAEELATRTLAALSPQLRASLKSALQKQSPTALTAAFKATASDKASSLAGPLKQYLRGLHAELLRLFRDTVTRTFGLWLLYSFSQDEVNRFLDAVAKAGLAAQRADFSATARTAFRQAVQGAFKALLDATFVADMAGQPGMQLIRAAAAQQKASGKGVTVAVLDTGVDLSHPYLAGSLARRGVDYVDGDRVPAEEGSGPSFGHGTHVAGLVHAVAPEASLLPIRVADSEGGAWSFILAEGIYYALAEGARVINLSLSFPCPSQLITDAVEVAEAQGALVVASVGNGGSRARSYPAQLEQVVGVAAVDNSDRRAQFSDYGPSVTLAAPGTAVYSAAPGGTYAWRSGTSFSTPLTAGVAALIYSAPGGPRDAGGVRGALKRSAVDIQALNPGQPLGQGRLDAAGAVR
ncbi:MAG: S8 family serine peptidase, partial [Chloroflexi bacterium]|nr:S8 family serine peptidase [Chloroflexota bacterium]